MLKNHIKSIFLVAMLFSRIVIGAETAVMSDKMDITERLNEQELSLVANHTNVVYLTPELVQALNFIEMKEDSALRDLKELVHNGYVVAPYESTLEAVTHAISLCQEDANHPALNELCTYHAMLKSGDASLIVETAERSCRSKKYRRVCVGSVVARCIRANSGNFCNLDVNGVLNVQTINGGSTCGATGLTGGCRPLSPCPLFINSDVRICGGLTGATSTFSTVNANTVNTVNENITGVLNVCNINGTGTTCVAGAALGCDLLINSNVNICGLINGASFPGAAFPTTCTGITPTASFPDLNVCGNVLFNTFGDAVDLNAIGSSEETRLAVLRETIGFGGSVIAVTVDNTAGLPVLGGAITLGGTLPTASVVSGAGMTLGAITPLTALNISLLGALTISGGIGNLSVQLPVTFPAGLFPAGTIPTVEATYTIENPAALINVVVPGVALSLTNLAVSATNVTNAGMTLVITAIPLGGGIFGSLVGITSGLSSLLNGLFNNNLRINLLVTGTTAPAA